MTKSKNQRALSLKLIGKCLVVATYIVLSTASARAAAPISCQFVMLKALEAKIDSDLRYRQSLGQGLQSVKFSEEDTYERPVLTIRSLPGLGSAVCTGTFVMEYDPSLNVLGCPHYTPVETSFSCI